MPDDPSNQERAVCRNLEYKKKKLAITLTMTTRMTIESTKIHDADCSQNDQCIRLILTNARSLYQKMNSLINMIKELELSFAAITETWFKGGMQLKQELGDIEHATGIKFLYRNRDGRKKIGRGLSSPSLQSWDLSLQGEED